VECIVAHIKVWGDARVSSRSVFFLLTRHSSGCDVINMSLGGLEYRKAPTHEEKKLIDWYKLIYNAAFNFAKKRGITTVVASGNFDITLKATSNTFVSWQISKPSFPLMHVDQGTGIRIIPM
jgi:hypothetical protein